MNDNVSRLANGLAGSAIGGTAGAAMGGWVVAGVCAVGGSVFGPAGTFFGAAVGSQAGAAVGGVVGSVGGFIYGVAGGPTQPNGRAMNPTSTPDAKFERMPPSVAQLRGDA